MGFGKSLKKFVKKAAPIVAMVAPFIPVLAPFAPMIGAVAGGMSGGAKGALMGGLGGFMASGLAGAGAAGGAGKFLTSGAAGGARLSGIAQPGLFARMGAGLKKFGSGIKGGIADFGKMFTTPGTAQAGQGIMQAMPTQSQVAGRPTNFGFDRAGVASLPASSGFLGPDTGVGPWSDIAKNVMSSVASPEEGEAANAGSAALEIYNTQMQGQGSQGGFMDFATNLFSEQNLPMTAGIAGMLAQMWENKQNEGRGEVTWGEGIDYSSPTRGTALTTPAAANGGRIGFANGSNLYSGDTGEQSLYRDLVRVFTGEITGAEARAIMEAAQGDLGPRAIEMAKQEASYKPSERLNRKANGGIIRLARGGEPTHEMDYRGGGFIPVGARERADDVPARLSKNEFVMTADAVRAAGGGSIDRGSQRMYDLMNNLEARA